MKTQKALVTVYDLTRLSSLVAGEDYGNSMADIDLRRKLRELLEDAKVIRPWHVSSDVVTMNSTVRLHDCRRNEDMSFHLVFPENEDLNDINISVLTPLGLAILGRKVGDIIFDGIRIEEVLFQPEAAGRFEL